MAIGGNSDSGGPGDLGSADDPGGAGGLGSIGDPGGADGEGGPAGAGEGDAAGQGCGSDVSVRAVEKDGSGWVSGAKGRRIWNRKPHAAQT